MTRPIDEPMRARFARPLLLIAGMAVLYGGTIWAGLQMSSRADGVFTFWPAAGFAAAIVANVGRKNRIPVIVGVAFGTILSALLAGDDNWAHTSGAAIANASEAAIAGAIISRYLPKARRIVRRRDIGAMVLAALVGAGAGGLIGGTATNLFFGSDLTMAILAWFAADSLGILLIGPGVLAAISVVKDHAPWHRWFGFSLAVAITAGTVFLAIWLRGVAGTQFAYLLLVPLMLTTIFVGQRAVAMLMALLSALVVAMTNAGLGPFVATTETRLQPVVAGQLFLLIIQITLMFMSVEASRRRDVLAEIEGVFEAALDSVLLVDETGTVRRANEASTQILGLDRKAIPGRNFADFLIEPLDAEAMVAQRAVLTKGKRANGEEFWAEVSEGKVIQEARRPRRAFIIRDVTARIEAQEQLEKLRDQFVSNMTHELRTPLTSIIGYTDWLIESVADQESKADLEQIQSSAKALQAMVDEILDFKRAVALAAEFVPVDFTRVVEGVVQQLHAASTAREVDLEMRVDDGVMVNGDLAQLERTVANLIGNAIKYSQPGGAVTVDLAALDREARLLVADNGIGISAADQARIFERFFRAGSAVSAGIPGTGLGLALARDIARSHKGDLSLESSLGVGTTVSLRLPLMILAAAPTS
jgi:PAS domain S-box-containing protein